MDWSQLKNRIIRAAKLDPMVYEEVEADPTAMSQAILVVVLSSLAAGLASIQQIGFGGIVMGTLAALGGWFIWALVIYLIGIKLFPEEQTRSDLGELLRTIGFSSSPGLIRILGIIPGLMMITSLVAAVWMIVAMVIAVRQALDYQSTWRAVGVVLAGWILQALFLALVLSLTGGLTGGPA